MTTYRTVKISLVRAYRGAVLFTRQLLGLIVKELVQLWRDRPLVFFLVYIFTANILTAGSESRDLSNARIVVCDSDHSQASRDLIYAFRPPYFLYAGEVSSAKEGLHALDRGAAVLFLDIPRKFEADLRRGEDTAEVQVHVDTSKATRGYLASSYAASIIALFTSSWVTQHNGAQGSTYPTIANNERCWYNPTLNDSWFGSIGALLEMMIVTCILLPGSALVRERERGTIEQLLVSPLSPITILLAKAIAMTIVMLIGTAVALFCVMQPVFRVPIRGSIGLFFLLTAVFALASAGLGLAASTFARNSGQVGIMVLLLVMPIIVLSGTWNPLESMPHALQLATLLSPLRHFDTIAYGILLRGEGMDTLWAPTAALTALGLALFAVALWRFQKQFQ